MSLVESFRAQLFVWKQVGASAAHHRDLNLMVEKEVKGEVGDEHWDRVKRAVNDIYSGQATIRRHSISPSLVTRGEVEMHGLSFPRFAVRAHLDDGGFIQVRRLGLLLKLLPEPLMGGPEELRYGGRTFRRIGVLKWEERFKNEYRSPIADCALTPPAALRRGFNFLRADLGKAYGEQSCEAVPYVQMMAHFGGAACVQACMLMSALIVSGASPHGSASASIHGPADMALLAGTCADGWIGLMGLFLEDAVSCLSAAGFCVSRHFASKYASYDTRQFAERMGSFVDAQIPVICSVNAAALTFNCYDEKAGEQFTGKRSPGIITSLFEKLWCAMRKPLTRILDGPTTSVFAGPPERNDHAVVIVGAARDRTKLVVNDPSHKPFRVVNPGSLRRASVCARFCAVYPPGVKLGLHEGIYSGPETKPLARPGVYEIAQHVHRTRNNRFDFGAVGPDPTDFGQFFLVKLVLSPKVRLLLPNGLTLLETFLVTAGEAKLVTALGKLPPKLSGIWVWLHLENKPRRLSIWLAEREVICLDFLPYIQQRDAETAIDSHLLAVLTSGKRLLEWEQVFINENYRPAIVDVIDNMTEQVRESRSMLAPGAGRGSTFRFGNGQVKPEISLVSSFCAKGLREAIELWPIALCKNCELYAFMHNDAEVFGVSLDQPAPPVQWLADYRNAAERRSYASAYARTLTDLAAKRHAELRIKALATFFPEIADRAHDRVMRPMAFLVDLARELRLLGHDVRTIELVAGNRIEGVEPYHDNDDGVVCFAKLREAIESSAVSSAASQHATVNVLAEVIRETKLLPDEKLTFSVELEPGEVFALHELQGIIALLSAIDSHSETDELQLRRIIGLNLDVGHFALARIEPKDLTADLRKRIAHIHFSDHRVGHLADLQLGQGGLGTRLGAAAFDPWLKVVKRIYTDGRAAHELPLSGLVSLELEATRSLKEIDDSLRLMGRWF